MKLYELIDKLEKIAEKNHDEFRYRVDINTRIKSATLVATETADNHDFFSTEIPMSAIEIEGEDIMIELSDACEHWGYDMP